jgi:hypothetical protein
MSINKVPESVLRLALLMKFAGFGLKTGTTAAGEVTVTPKLNRLLERFITLAGIIISNNPEPVVTEVVEKLV